MKEATFIIIAVGWLVSLAKGQVFYADASSGNDVPSCGLGTGTSACETIERMLQENPPVSGVEYHLAAGLYSGATNVFMHWDQTVTFDIVFTGAPTTPPTTILDCGGGTWLWDQSSHPGAHRISNILVQNCVDDIYGGAFLYVNPAVPASGSLEFSNVHFKDATQAVGVVSGSAIQLRDANATFVSCFWESLHATALTGTEYGVIFVFRSVAVFDSCFFLNNWAEGASGAALGFSTDSFGLVKNSTFAGNRGRYGNDIYIWHSASVELHTCEFEGDIAYANNWYGGSVYNRGNLVVKGCNFSKLIPYTSLAGGHIYSFEGNLTVEQSNFEQGWSTSAGGGCIRVFAGDVVRMHEVTFKECFALDDDGGGLSVGNGVQLLTVSSCDFFQCHADWGGGGLAAVAQSMSISQSTFILNSAWGGGAMYIGSPTSKITAIDQVRAINNTASNTGGAIKVAASGHLAVFNATLEGNGCPNCQGGALYADSNERLDLELVTVSDGFARYGGGAYISSWSSTIENCLFKDLTATNGGALFYGAFASHSITNSEFVGNFGMRQGGSIMLGVHAVVETTNLRFLGGGSDRGGAIMTCKCFGEGALGRVWNAAGFGMLTMDLARFEKVHANFGAALFLASQIQTSIMRTSFTSTTATASGGGVYASLDSILVMNDTVVFNASSGVAGGALYSEFTAQMKLTNVTVRQCSSLWAGGLYATDESVVHFHGTMKDCRSAMGGAVVAEQNAAVFAQMGSELTSNVAELQGGAVWCSDAASVTFFSGEIKNNSAGNGAGIYAERECALFLDGTMFSSNNASLDGGALALFNSQNELGSLINVNFVANQAWQGGGDLFWFPWLENRSIAASEPLCFGCSSLGSSATYQDTKGWATPPIRLDVADDAGLRSSPLVSGELIDSDAFLRMQVKDFYDSTVSSLSSGTVEIHTLTPSAVVFGATIASITNGEAMLSAFGVSSTPGQPLDLEVVSSEENIEGVLVSAVAVQTCLAGQWRNDRLCLPCAAGSHNPTPGLNAVCTPCPPGSRSVAPLKNVSSKVGSVECVECERGEASGGSKDACDLCTKNYYSSLPGQAMCSACPPNSEPLIESLRHVGCACSVGFYASLDFSECIECPKGAACDRVGLQEKDVTAADGFWRAPNLALSDAFFACTSDVVGCEGGGCAEGRSGRLCSECSQGFGDAGDGCQKCYSSLVNGVMIALAIIVPAVTVWFLKRSATRTSEQLFEAEAGDDEEAAAKAVEESGRFGAATRVVIDFAQFTSGARDILLDWPSVVISLLRVEETVTAGPNMPGMQLTINCWTNNNFFTRFLFYMLFPLVVVLGIAVFYTIKSKIDRRRRAREISVNAGMAASVLPSAATGLGRGTGRARRRALNNAICACVIALFLSYPSIAKSVIAMFHCVPIGDKSYLASNMSVECYGSIHLPWLFLGLVACIVYVVGVPFAALLVLRKHAKRGDLWNDPTLRQRYFFIFCGYRKKYYWWPIIVLARKLLMIIILVFLGNSTLPQAYSAVWLIMIALVAQVAARPFLDKHLNKLEFLSLLVTWTTLQIGMYFHYQPRIPQALHVVFTIMVIVGNGVFLAYAILFIVREGGRTVKRKAKSLMEKKRSMVEEKEMEQTEEEVLTKE